MAINTIIKLFANNNNVRKKNLMMPRKKEMTFSGVTKKVKLLNNKSKKV